MIFSGLHMASVETHIKRWFSGMFGIVIATSIPALRSYLSKMRFRADWCAFQIESMFDEPWAALNERGREERGGYSPWESLMPSASSDSNEDGSARVQISVWVAYRTQTSIRSVNITARWGWGLGVHRDLPLQSPLCNFGKVACDWYWQTDES